MSISIKQKFSLHLGAVEGSGNPMIYRSKKGIPRDVQEGSMAIALTPFHLIVGDVLGNINILDFLNADRKDEVRNEREFVQILSYVYKHLGSLN